MKSEVKSAVKFTPGPWKVEIGTWAKVICRSGDKFDGATIAEVYNGEPNARLIAAAPELLEACRNALNLVKISRDYFPKSMHHSDKFQLENICATLGKAISKATGETL